MQPFPAFPNADLFFEYAHQPLMPRCLSRQTFLYPNLPIPPCSPHQFSPQYARRGVESAYATRTLRKPSFQSATQHSTAQHSTARADNPLSVTQTNRISGTSDTQTRGKCCTEYKAPKLKTLDSQPDDGYLSHSNTISIHPHQCGVLFPPHFPQKCNFGGRNALQNLGYGIRGNCTSIFYEV